jgi:hypothetical protein
MSWQHLKPRVLEVLSQTFGGYLPADPSPPPPPPPPPPTLPHTHTHPPPTTIQTKLPTDHDPKQCYATVDAQSMLLFLIRSPNATSKQPPYSCARNNNAAVPPCPLSWCAQVLRASGVCRRKLSGRLSKVRSSNGSSSIVDDPGSSLHLVHCAPHHDWYPMDVAVLADHTKHSIA